MYFFKPISECDLPFTGTSQMTDDEVSEALKPFYVIAIRGNDGKPDTLCKTPPIKKQEFVIFHDVLKRIGIPEFNIPCELTLDAPSSDIKEAIEVFYREWNAWDEQVIRKMVGMAPN